MAEYQIKKGVLGQKVLYNCPSCGSPLTSSFDKAGTQDFCPDCSKPHVIPGAKEKHALEQAAAVKRQHEVETEKKRIEETARRARALAAAAASPHDPSTAPVVNANIVDRSKKSNVRRRRFGDDILDVAFAIARGFSVFVIFISLAALVVIAVLILQAYYSFRPNTSKPIALPTDAEFIAYQKRLEESPTPSAEAKSSSNYTDDILTMLKKHRLDGAAFYRKVLEIQLKLGFEEFPTFMAAFDTFVSKHGNNEFVADWFCDSYLFNYDLIQQKKAEDKSYNLQVSTRISGLVTAALATFGGLISFMALPLLIRIEANTSEPAKT